MIKKVQSKEAPAAVGPYSQAIMAEANKLIFVSGQIPLVPSSMKVEASDIVGQTRQVLDNLSAVLKAAEASLEQVVKTTVYIKDMNDFSTINEVYAEYFKAHAPARACVEVARLPKDVLIEIDAIAVI